MTDGATLAGAPLQLLASIVLLGLFIVGVETMNGEPRLDQPAARIAGLFRQVSDLVWPAGIQEETDPSRWGAVPSLHAAPDLAVPAIVEARLPPASVLRVGGWRDVHLHERST